MYITLEQTIEQLHNHQVVALPTETVYGLAARITDETAVKKIFEIKNRPTHHPLIVHVSSSDMAKSYAKNWNEIHQILADEFWPGPLTLLTAKSTLVPNYVTGGSSLVGLRMPKHPLFLSVLQHLNEPLVAPSANPHLQTSPTQAAHVEALFNGKIPTLDGGPCQVGLESSIVEIHDSHDAITLSYHRPGNILPEMIEKALRKKLNKEVLWSQTKSAPAPGSMSTHYRPKFPLIVTNNYAQFLKEYGQQNLAHQHLCLKQSPAELSPKLYDLLHSHKPKSHDESLVLELPNLDERDPQWSPLLDRLRKASQQFVIFS